MVFNCYTFTHLVLFYMNNDPSHKMGKQENVSKLTLLPQIVPVRWEFNTIIIIPES